jgi:hypothetical protein
VDWISRLERYLAEVEDRIAAVSKTIRRQKQTIARLRAANGGTEAAERALAAYHREGLWLIAQRDRVRRQLARIRQQQHEKSSDALDA